MSLDKETINVLRETVGYLMAVAKKQEKMNLYNAKLFYKRAEAVEKIITNSDIFEKKDSI